MQRINGPQRLVLAVLGVILVTPLASAQLPVIDEANLIQNTITAVEAIAQTLNQIIELTALDEFVLDSAEFFEDLAALEAMVQEGVALGWDLSSLQSQVLILFDLNTAPLTSFEYRQRSAEMRQTIWLAYSYAMRVQTLIRSAIRTVQHITGILGQVAGAIGNLTVSQGLGQSQAKLQQLLVENNVQRAAFERAKSLEGAEIGVLLQGLRNINDAMMADHP
jgi:hypothetical protein